MPLLNIVGITATYNSFSAGFAFLCEEIEETHSWWLQKYKDITKISSKVIVPDRELALMNSIEKVFPSTQNLLCIWYINKSIAAKCKPLVSASLWDSFLLQWNACVSSHTIDSFEENWASIHLSSHSWTCYLCTRK
jgi:histone-lysine N-methyltransferase SETD2